MRVPAPWRALVLVLLLGGCQGFDPQVFDERLRAATFDHYVDEIGLQLAVDRPELSADALSGRFRARAVAAQTPWQFYGVLLEVLRELRDPHADLELSKHPWNVTDLGSAEAVVDAVPFPPDVVRAEGSWWVAHRPALPPPDASLASRLIASAGEAARPYTWSRLVALAGRPVESHADIKLPRRGPLLEPLVAEVLGEDGRPVRLELLRNGLVGTDARGRATIVSPQWIAQHLCRPSAAASAPAASAPATPASQARVVTLAAPPRPHFRGVTMARRTSGWRADQQIDAWRLGTTGYLRLGAFPAATEDGLAFREALGRVAAQLLDCDTLVVDLLDNPGGAWDSMCQAAGFFLPRSDASVPHVGHRRTRTDYGLVVSYVNTVTSCPRAEVPELTAGRVIVLTSQRTASSAEILAAMLRARRGATLLGERTVGAETWVHEVEGPDGSRIRFGLPGGMTAGAHFQGRGLLPDVPIELSHADLVQHGAEEALRRLRHAIRAAGLRAAGLDPDGLLGPIE